MISRLLVSNPVKLLGSDRRASFVTVSIPAGEKPYLNRVREKKGMLPNDVRGAIFGTIIVP